MPCFQEAPADRDLLQTRTAVERTSVPSQAPTRTTRVPVISEGWWSCWRMRSSRCGPEFTLREEEPGRDVHDPALMPPLRGSRLRLRAEHTSAERRAGATWASSRRRRPCADARGQACGDGGFAGSWRGAWAYEAPRGFLVLDRSSRSSIAPGGWVRSTIRLPALRRRPAKVKSLDCRLGGIALLLRCFRCTPVALVRSRLLA